MRLDVMMSFRRRRSSSERGANLSSLRVSRFSTASFRERCPEPSEGSEFRMIQAATQSGAFELSYVMVHEARAFRLWVENWPAFPRGWHPRPYGRAEGPRALAGPIHRCLRCPDGPCRTSARWDDGRSVRSHMTIGGRPADTTRTDDGRRHSKATRCPLRSVAETPGTDRPGSSAAGAGAVAPGIRVRLRGCRHRAEHPGRRGPTRTGDPSAGHALAISCRRCRSGRRSGRPPRVGEDPEARQREAHRADHDIGHRGHHDGRGAGCPSARGIVRSRVDPVG